MFGPQSNLRRDGGRVGRRRRLLPRPLRYERHLVAFVRPPATVCLLNPMLVFILWLTLWTPRADLPARTCRTSKHRRARFRARRYWFQPNLSFKMLNSNITHIFYSALWLTQNGCFNFSSTVHIATSRVMWCRWSILFVVIILMILKNCEYQRKFEVISKIDLLSHLNHSNILLTFQFYSPTCRNSKIIMKIVLILVLAALGSGQGE